MACFQRKAFVTAFGGGTQSPAKNTARRVAVLCMTHFLEARLQLTMIRLDAMKGNYGTNVEIKRSSYDNNEKLWVFIRNSPTGPVKGVLNLNRDQAVDLAVLLLDASLEVK